MDIEITLHNVDPMLLMMLSQAQTAEDVAEVQRELDRQELLEKIAAFKERYSE